MQPNEQQTPSQPAPGLDPAVAYTAPIPAQPPQQSEPLAQPIPAPTAQTLPEPQQPIAPAPFVPPSQPQQISAPVIEQPQTQEVAYGTPQTELPPEDSYDAEDEELDTPTDLPEIRPITWQAQEYLQHDKPPLWYIVFGVVVFVLVGAAILLQAWTFVALIPVMAVALVVYVHRPPHVVSYAASEKGLYFNDTLHPMGEFKTFSVVQGTNPQQNQLILIPVKRFRPSLTIFFPSEIGEELVDIMGAYLPSQPYKPDVFDKIIQKLHI